MALSFPSFTTTWHTTPYAAIDPTIQPTLSASGKVIFITGGGKGIGEAIALHFARAGARALVLTGRTASSLESCKAKIEAISQNILVETIVVDITDSTGIGKAFNTANARFGAIDVLVNNAAYLTDEHISVAKSVLDDYWHGFEVNIKGSLIVTQEFLQSGVAVNKGATVINITSGAAHIPYIPGYSGYSASKLGFAKIMEYVQYENKERELRVFNLQPGAVETDMTRKAGNVKTTNDIGEIVRVAAETNFAYTI
jgi:NAD(P)-dependent dehydrogenase (short-subunit alcohol dehydrogenase family)